MKAITIMTIVILFLVLPVLVQAESKSLVGVSDNGKILSFSDGSRYRVDRSYASGTAGWSGENQIQIFDKGRTDWINVPIMNPLTGSTVCATKIQ